MGNDSYEPSPLDRARDELFSHIRRCGVLEAELDQREEWLSDTVGYLAERYPDLGKIELAELHAIGQRYCMPPIRHGGTGASDGETEGSHEHELDEERGEVNAA